MLVSPRPQKDQQAGTRRRAPILESRSSSSSLGGLELAIPSFQSFIKRTPRLLEQKPLPPTPPQPRRESSVDSCRSSRVIPSFPYSRRTSSVYSRPMSERDLETDVPGVPSVPLWQTAEFDDQSNFLLRPLAYGANTSQLIANFAAPQVLQPRTYCPLINTPSPTVSRRTTPSPHAESRASVLLPPSLTEARTPQRHLCTVSLEKAKELMQAPGAVHLLPEELRAQILNKPEMIVKAQPQNQLRVTSIDTLGCNIITPLDAPGTPTLVDTQGRERLLRAAPMTTTELQFPTMTSLRQADTSVAFELGNELGNAMAPIALKRCQQSRDKVIQTLSLGDSDEPQGRIRTRDPRKRSCGYYLPKAKHLSDASGLSGELMNDAQRIAQDYHQLLSEEYRQSSVSPTLSGHVPSSAEVMSRMKLMPQPLFDRDLVTNVSGTMADAANRNSKDWPSPKHARVDSGVASNSHHVASVSNSGEPLFGRPPPERRPKHNRQSTSGSIPICPPSMVLPRKVSVILPHTVEEPNSKLTRVHVNREDNRVSHFYPHIMSRKIKKEKAHKKGTGQSSVQDKNGGSQAPHVLLLPATAIVAERLTTSETNPKASPLRRNPVVPLTRRRSGGDRASTYSTEQSNRRLHERMLSKLTKSCRSHSRTERSPTRFVASPNSPHLLPPPASGKSSSSAAHQGWTDFARSTFDHARTSDQTTRKRPVQPAVIHPIPPARPLDESLGAMRDGSPPTRPGLFGELVDRWRESKAEKRRKDLKRIIKVVTPTHLQA